MDQDRLPPIPGERMTDAQRAAADAFVSLRGRELFGPFVAMLRSPEVMLASAAMGDYVRYRSVLPPRLSELAILVTARHWTQHYEWAVHAPIALAAGIPLDTIDAIANGERPAQMSDEATAVYDFISELYRARQVSDAAYHGVYARFGEQGIVDLLGIAGHYTFLSMVMNTARTALPEGSSPALPDLPGGRT